jgi:transglutaminase-like putative cysteine protease
MIAALQLNRWPASARELTFSASVILLAMIPHLPHLPVWVPAIFIGSLLWRIAIEIRGATMPKKWISNLLALVSLISVFSNYRSLNGLEAGTALLSVMSGMKLLESRNDRDYSVLVFISFFLIFAELLYDQSLWMLPYSIAATLVSIAVLMRIHDGGANITFKTAIKRCSWIALQAAPFAILLFVLFPRMQGQFWALPSRGAATSGLSDSMSPGDVSKLSLSDDVAFRVEFSNVIPNESQRYWRTVVLHDFDGRTWKRNWQPAGPSTIDQAGTPIDYRILLEPSNQRWIPMLDVPVASQLPRSKLTQDLQLVAAEPIATLTAVDAHSMVKAQFGIALSPTEQFIDTRLPKGRNPRSRELARSMSAQSQDAPSYINAVLRMFHQENFSYTLEPTALGYQPVDDFLFNTRNGFCEHYASAFTVMMRAAGIPARVVTGYQGGEVNALGDYMIVRQSDAHAWSEVWLADRGWVRVDPTAAIAPERVNRGLSSAMSATEPVPGRLLRQFAWLNKMRLSVDAINTFWKRGILQFDALTQHALLMRIGIDSTDWHSMAVLLGIAFVAFFVGILGFLAWRYQPVAMDPAQSEYLRLQRKLEKRGLTRQLHEGPSDFLFRAAASLPAHAIQLRDFRQQYLSIRYLGSDEFSNAASLRELVNRI